MQYYRLTQEELAKLVELFDMYIYLQDKLSFEQYHKAHVAYLGYVGELRNKYGIATKVVRRIDWENGLMEVLNQRIENE